MAHVVALPDGFVVSDERARLPMAFVHAALAGAYWMEQRSPALTERSWAHCLVLGVHAPGGQPVGCCRVLTDRTLRAHLADLVIVPSMRGRGLGKALVAAALAHPELATVGDWTLRTSDAHGLYSRHGFRQDGADPAWMILHRTVRS